MKIQDDERRIAAELHDSAGRNPDGSWLESRASGSEGGGRCAGVGERSERSRGSGSATPSRDTHSVVSAASHAVRRSRTVAPPAYVQGVADRSGMQIDLSVPRISEARRTWSLRFFGWCRNVSQTFSSTREKRNRATKWLAKTEPFTSKMRDEGKGIFAERLAEIGLPDQHQDGRNSRSRRFSGEMKIGISGSGTAISASIPIAINFLVAVRAASAAVHGRAQVAQTAASIRWARGECPQSAVCSSMPKA